MGSVAVNADDAMEIPSNMLPKPLINLMRAWFDAAYDPAVIGIMLDWITDHGTSEKEKNLANYLQTGDECGYWMVMTEYAGRECSHMAVGNTQVTSFSSSPEPQKYRQYKVDWKTGRWQHRLLNESFLPTTSDNIPDSIIEYAFFLRGTFINCHLNTT